MQTPKVTVCMKYQILFSGRNKTILEVFYAEFAKSC